MKFKLSNIITTTVSAIAILGYSAVAQAATLFPQPVNGIFRFNQDTVATFKFIESHGFWRSNYGIIDKTNSVVTKLFAESTGFNPSGPDKGTERNDWLGSPNILTGGTAASIQTFTFLKGVDYQIGLWGINTNPLTPPANNSASNHLQLFQDAKTGIGSYTFKANGPNWNGTPDPDKTVYGSTPNALIVGFEDGWEANNGKTPDFNDLIVEVDLQPKQAVPESSSSPAILGVTLLGLFAIKRLKPKRGLKH